jgi:chemotaxis protein MotB
VSAVADEKPHEILIIKRSRDREDHGHGGAWKIAFADFMTAMMALFLVMWLISATNEKTKASLARYFNPVKLVDMTVQKRGLHDPVERSPEDAIPDDPNAKERAPKGKTDPKDLAAAKGKNPADGGPADFQPKHSEAALFRDPYAVLAEIAATGASANPSDKIEHPNVGAAASFEDPFQAGAPVLPGKTTPSPTQGAGDQLSPGGGTANPVQPTSQSVVAPQVAPQPNDQFAAGLQPVSQQPPPNPNDVATTTEPKPQDTKAQAATADAVKPDANKNPANTVQAAKSDTSKNDTANNSAAKNQAASQEAAKPANQPKPPSAEELQLARVQNEVSSVVGKNEPMPNVQVKTTPEGLLISLTDGFNYAMFAVGSAEPQARTVQIMEKIAKIIKKEKGDIVICGHTDGRQYKSRNYDNWRLSEARAQMAYYMLVRGGLEEKRIVKIEGAADRQLKVASDPLAAENRRIEIFLRKSHS